MFVADSYLHWRQMGLNFVCSYSYKQASSLAGSTPLKLMYDFTDINWCLLVCQGKGYDFTQQLHRFRVWKKLVSLYIKAFSPSYPYTTMLVSPSTEKIVIFNTVLTFVICYDLNIHVFLFHGYRWLSLLHIHVHEEERNQTEKDTWREAENNIEAKELFIIIIDYLCTDCCLQYWYLAFFACYRFLPV